MSESLERPERQMPPRSAASIARRRATLFAHTTPAERSARMRALAERRWALAAVTGDTGWMEEKKAHLRARLHETMTPQERSERARRAALARWHPDA